MLHCSGLEKPTTISLKPCVDEKPHQYPEGGVSFTQYTLLRDAEVNLEILTLGSRVLDCHD
jgi:hypothetical protein